MLHKYEPNPVRGKLNIRHSAIAFAVMAMFLGACGPDGGIGGTRTTTTPTAEDVTRDTQQLIGRSVTVRSEPIEKVSPSAFTIRDNRIFGEDILVLNASGQPFVLPAEDGVEIQATGQVEQFSIAEMQRRYNLNLDPNFYGRFEGRPTIIAQSVAIAPRPGDISNNPTQYYGRVVAVPGEVENVLGPNAFVIEDRQFIGGQNLLVLTPQQATVAPQQGRRVVATGVLRRMTVAEIEREHNFAFDPEMRRRIEVEYRDQPVLVADSVYPAEAPTAAR